jgi:hypothetical protein
VGAKIEKTTIVWKFPSKCVETKWELQTTIVWKFLSTCGTKWKTTTLFQNSSKSGTNWKTNSLHCSVVSLSLACRTNNNNNKMSDYRHPKKKKNSTYYCRGNWHQVDEKKHTSAKTTKHVNMDEQQSENWMNHLHYHLL